MNKTHRAVGVGGIYNGRRQRKLGGSSKLSGRQRMSCTGANENEGEGKVNSEDDRGAVCGRDRRGMESTSPVRGQQRYDVQRDRWEKWKKVTCLCPRIWVRAYTWNVPPLEQRRGSQYGRDIGRWEGTMQLTHFLSSTDCTSSLPQPVRLLAKRAMSLKCSTAVLCPRLHAKCTSWLLLRMSQFGKDVRLLFKFAQSASVQSDCGNAPKAAAPVQEGGEERDERSGNTARAVGLSICVVLSSTREALEGRPSQETLCAAGSLTVVSGRGRVQCKFAARTGCFWLPSLCLLSSCRCLQ
jgi:hypothetical protein